MKNKNVYNKMITFSKLCCEFGVCVNVYIISGLCGETCQRDGANYIKYRINVSRFHIGILRFGKKVKNFIKKGIG